MALRLANCPAGFALILSPKAQGVIFDDKLQGRQVTRELPSCWGAVYGRVEARREDPSHPVVLDGGGAMSALTVVKVSGDIDRFRQALLDRGDEFAKIAEEARSGERCTIGSESATDSYWSSTSGRTLTCSCSSSAIRAAGVHRLSRR
jgi:hypothetical protein